MSRQKLMIAENSLPELRYFSKQNDNEDVSSQDLFVAFLINCKGDNSIKKINLICYENPPAFYLQSNRFTDKSQPVHEKITAYNYFSDPCGWNNMSTPKTDLSVFISDSKGLKESAFFIDSMSLLVQYHGFCTVYKNLSVLKKYSEKLVCVVHEDLFSSENIKELSFLATAFIELQDCLVKNSSREKIIKVTYKKPGGNIFNQEEIFFIDNQLNVSSKIKESKALVLSNTKEYVENLTTFKLGLHMSEGERKARNELMLPYLKTQLPNQSGEILYQAEAYELEDDPDDDLDI